MAEVTKNIGLSLGADICWPACYEGLMRRLDLRLPIGDDLVRLAVERVTVEPFDLRQPCRYDVVIDRLTHWFHTSREWIKKAVILDGLYVLNNPWTVQSMEKLTTYAAMIRLGMPIPETWLVPPQVPPSHADANVTVAAYGKPFDLAEIGHELGYPLYMKPYDGGGWVGVNRIGNEHELREAYRQSGQSVMHLQASVEGFDRFVRCIGLGPQVHIVNYDPSAPLHGRYKVDFFFVDGDEWELLTDTTLAINAFFGWEFNSCEALRKDGVFHPIDFANACPDFQVTSLHYHFPIMVKNMIAWSTFCAATGRKMRQNVDWEPFYAIARQDLPYRERLAGYARIARERMQADAFEEFKAKHLGHLDEVAWEFFATDEAKQAVRAKVAALYPAHEIEQFTEHFWGLIQFWRKTEEDRLGWTRPAPENAVEAATGTTTTTTPAQPATQPAALLDTTTTATPNAAEGLDEAP